MTPTEQVNEKMGYTVNEAATVSGIKRTNLRRLIKEKQVKHIRIGTRIIIPRWALEEFMLEAVQQ
jgi:excisionase family DNA binding protein